PGTGIPPRELERVVGATVRTAVSADETLQWSVLEPLASTTPSAQPAPSEPEGVG
ncbi:MAG: hypothetical protein HKN12_06910, partial [Gemmatimonadetes bacterium]|nr:hypothetical protein [Gemmatimonadota bacterium]